MVQDSSLIRVMALHALAYCERLFYLEEVEKIRLADAAVYAGRTLHENLEKAQEEDGTWSILEMASENLGLICNRHYKTGHGKTWNKSR